MDPAHRSRGVYSALAHTAFALVWSGALVSNVGNWIESVSQSWLVYEKSGHSTTWTGGLFCVGIVPMAVLALPMGVAADRFNRRKLLLLFQVLMAIGAALQAIACHLGYTSPGTTVGIALIEGICAGAMGPVWHSLVPELVPREDLGGAIALNSAQFNVARSIGPMIAAVIIAWWGLPMAFDLNVLSFALVIFALVIVKTNDGKRQVSSSKGLAALLDGLKATKEHAGMFRLVWSGSVFVLFTAPIFALLPKLANVNLGGEEGTYSSLMSAIGSGAVFGAFFMTRIARTFKRQTAIGLAALLTGAALGGLAFTHSKAVALGFLFLFGLGWCVLLTTQNTALQMLTPDAIRARIMSVNVLAFVAAPIGQIFFGWVAEPVRLDVSGTLYVLGSGALAVGIFQLLSRVPEMEGSALGEEPKPILVEA